MPKTKISEYSSTANNNTDIGGINIDEGCAPSGINNAIRTLMAQLKDLQAGTSGDLLAVTAGGTGVSTSTGSGNNVLSTSPTLVTPALGTPSALVGTNITGTAAAFNIGGTATTATNLAGGANGTIPYQSASGTTQMLAVGTSGQFLQSQGSAAPAWVTTVATATIPRSTRTSNTILASADASTLVAITSGTFTQTFTAAATLGSGWFCYIQNLGTGDITLDPNGSETIDGLTSYIMYPNEVRLVQCNGTSFNTIVLNPFTRSFSATGTFTKPPCYSQIYAECWGAGGGGGSGGFKAGGTAAQGGGGGGGGYMFRPILASALSSSETVTIGAGGAGGAGVGTIGQSPDENTGVTGTGGGNTTFSTCTATGGNGGQGGRSNSSAFTQGGAGGGYGTNNTTSTNTNYAFGGGSGFTQSGDSPVAAFAYAIYGGGGGGGNAYTSPYSGASSLFGGSGGSGSGGGAAGSVKNGGNGGNAASSGTSQAGGAGGSGFCTLRGVV
jgi:hypothetical protein